jgi:hypothetical protein
MSSVGTVKEVHCLLASSIYEHKHIDYKKEWTGTTNIISDTEKLAMETQNGYTIQIRCIVSVLVFLH